MVNDDLDYPWPSKHDRPFIPPTSKSQRARWTFDGPRPGWLLESEYRDGYFEAGVILATRLKGETREDRVHRGVALPMLFCFRHFLELATKSLIASTCTLTDESVPNEVQTEHRIMRLWTILKPLMAKAYPPHPRNADDVRNVERCLNDFHQVDSSSQTFRYAHDRAGQAVDHRLPLIDLDQLLKTMSNLRAFYNGCEDFADHLLDAKSDAEWEYIDWHDAGQDRESP